MKKAFLMLFFYLCICILANASFSGDTTTQDVRKPLRISGKQIYTEDILHTESEVLMLLSISPDFVDQYQKGKSLRNGYSYFDYNGTYYLGLVIASLGELMIDGAVVCKIVGKGYIRKSIANYNQAIKTSGYVPGSLNYQLGVLDNGMIGLKVTF